MSDIGMNDAYRQDLTTLIRLIEQVVYEDDRQRTQTWRMRAEIRRRDMSGSWDRLRRPHRRKRQI